MYFKTLDAIENTMEILEKAEKECEEIYVSSEEIPLKIKKSDKENK